METETLTKDDILEIIEIIQDYIDTKPHTRRDKEIIEILYNIAKNIK